MFRNKFAAALSAMLLMMLGLTMGQEVCEAFMQPKVADQGRARAAHVLRCWMSDVDKLNEGGVRLTTATNLPKQFGACRELELLRLLVCLYVATKPTPPLHAHIEHRAFLLGQVCTHLWPLGALAGVPPPVQNTVAFCTGCGN